VSAQSFEAYLARIYVDADSRAEFLANPRAAAASHGLTPEECDALARIDVAGLEFAASSFEHKRQEKERAKNARRQGAGRGLRRLLAWCGYR